VPWAFGTSDCSSIAGQTPYVREADRARSTECLDNMIVFGEAHLRRILGRYAVPYLMNLASSPRWTRMPHFHRAIAAPRRHQHHSMSSAASSPILQKSDVSASTGAARTRLGWLQWTRVAGLPDQRSILRHPAQRQVRADRRARSGCGSGWNAVTFTFSGLGEIQLAIVAGKFD